MGELYPTQDQCEGPGEPICALAPGTLPDLGRRGRRAREQMNLKRAFIPVFAALSMGCTVVSPPPLMPHLAGTAPNTAGDMRILLMAGVGLGFGLNYAFGGELRVESQVNEWATVGGGFGGGLRLQGGDDHELNHPRWFYGARTWGRFNPGQLDWLAITAGAGLVGPMEGWSR